MPKKVNPLESFVANLCPSMVKLPAIIETVNTKSTVNGKLVGRYDWLIERAKKGYYHDYKFQFLPDVDYVDPKAELLRIIAQNSPLDLLIDPIELGYLTDQMDDADKANLRDRLGLDKSPQVDLRTLGL